MQETNLFSNNGTPVPPILPLPSTSSDDAVHISKRSIPLKVTSIESVFVVNKTYFSQPDETAVMDGVTIPLFGKLKQADLKITFTIPDSIALQPSDISANITKSTGLATEDISVELLHTQEYDCPDVQTKSSLPTKFSVILPLYRGLHITKPLLDQITASTGQQWTHITLLFNGIQMQNKTACTWRIRIRSIQLEDKLECVSVTDSPIDIPRMQESWLNFKNWVKVLPRKIEQLLQTNSTPTQPQTQTSLTSP